MVRVLFVCLGNICRSPTAEGTFRRLVTEAGLSNDIAIDSAGTATWHVGKAPDPRTQAAAKRRGIDLSGLRGRQATADDFRTFDYVLAMDRENHRNLQRLAPGDGTAALHLFLEFAADSAEDEVPDPYYGGDQGFEHVLDLIEDASGGLLAHIRQSHGL